MANKRRDKVEKLLTGGISKDININDINNELAKDRLRVLTDDERRILAESGLVTDNGTIPQLWGNFKTDTDDILKGLYTIGAVPIEYGKQGLRKFSSDIYGGTLDPSEYSLYSGINRVVGKGVNSLIDNPLGTVAGGAKGFADLLLNDYNTDVDDLVRNALAGNTEEFTDRIIPNAVQGAYNRPLTTALNLAPLSKLLPKGAITKLIHKTPLPKGVKNLFPTNEMEKVNQIIADTKNQAGVDLASGTSRLNELKVQQQLGRVKPEEVVKNLRTGEWTGNKATLKATEDFRDLSNQYSKYAQELGVPASETENVITANYLLEQLDPDRTKGFQTGELQNLINRFNQGEDIANDLGRFGVDEYGLTGMLGNAEQLRQQNKLAHISQLFAGNQGLPDVDSIEGITPRLQQFLSGQNVGTATNQEIGDVLADTYNFLGRRLENARATDSAVRDTARNLGRKVNPTDTLGANEIFVSPDYIRQSLGSSFQDPSRSIVASLSSLNSGIPKSQLNAFKDDLYALDKDLLQGIVNSQTRGSNSTINNLNNTFKGTMLTTPKFFTDNRYGNMILNAIEGVMPSDYLEALKDIRARQLAPAKLANETSYAGFLGKDFAGNTFVDAQQKALAGMLGKDVPFSERFKNANLFFANPIIGLESNFERTDRLANMIRQAKRMAKPNENWRDIIKRSETDSNLYREINNKINNSLGDYAGRNYYLDPKAQEGLNLLYNFYKYPAQSGRVLAHQAVNRPLSFQSMVHAPELLGEQIADIEAPTYHGQPSEGYEGGLVGKTPERTFQPYEVDRYQANPITAPLEVLSNLTSGKWEKAINDSPILSNAYKIINYVDDYGNPPTSPNYQVSGGNMIKRVNGRPTGEIYEPTGMDRLRYAGALLGNQFITPVVQMNRSSLPLYAEASDQTYYPRYDTSLLGQVGEGGEIPFIREGNIQRKGKSGFEDLVENLFGMQRYKVRQDRDTISPTQLRNMLKWNNVNEMWKGY